MRNNFWIVFILASFLYSCHTSKEIAGPTVIVHESVEEEDSSEPLADEDSFVMPDFMVQESLPLFRSKQAVKWELIHTDLVLSFDWEKQRVNGMAELTVSPKFYKDSILILDAKNFDFHRISFSGNSDNLSYQYDSLRIEIPLGKTFSSSDTIVLSVTYTAKPAERKSISGSSAITSNQGLFFINHDGKIKGKPQQIWTQGETSYNSCWFPTLDAPNQRATHDIKLKIEDRFKTLSNGILIGSRDIGEGFREDHWRMDMAHAPYLTMLAIGEFAVVKDKWKHLDLGYWVEPEYEAHAKDIFAHTPEMLSFFSDLYGVAYPWQKYHQVIVRDFVSGAMENTTAVIFGDFVQRTRRQLMDNGNDKIVAHEMAHHWFGNLVTCADWSQLTMNEGFANYAEYLWLEHKYGLGEAEIHRKEELDGYLQSTLGGGTKHLIRYDYEDEEEMFDAHSYNKGGLVLHMLRKLLGDEAFFASIQHYLVKNAFSPVEVHQLRLAVEQVSGIDYSWFFNQWFLDRGHPELRVDKFYDDSSKVIYLSAHQIQDPEQHRSVFKLPIEVDLYYEDGQVERKMFWTDKRSVVKEFQLERKPVDVVFDPESTLLCVLEPNWDMDEFAAVSRFLKSKNYIHRLEALIYLAEEESAAMDSLSMIAITDDFWLMRLLGASALPDYFNEESTLSTLTKMALADPHLNVRYQALERISERSSQVPSDVFVQILEKGELESGQIVGKAISIWYADRPDEAAEWRSKLMNDQDASVITAISDIIVKEGDTESIPFLLENYSKIDGYDAITFMSQLFDLTADLPSSEILSMALKLQHYALEEDSKMLQRYGVVQFVSNHLAVISNQLRLENPDNFIELTRDYEKLLGIFERIVSAETNPQLKGAYEYLRP